MRAGERRRRMVRLCRWFLYFLSAHGFNAAEHAIAFHLTTLAWALSPSADVLNVGFRR
jgi:hypothetical protein